ncbi:DHS-like NAD/FAD-binding domain-containing protein, partial [Coniochaeta ligniaria NRRL 30616]
MPTVHVTPGSDLLLQDIANSLHKAKKVVVVTGAGISTNSGIPDFRSENGLYSLIQAQFDAASRELEKRAEERDGRDLFDASIWADPIKTSVFYTFATTLRQKARDVSPTASHLFLSVLRDQRKLVRCYTQNIDRLEDRIGLSTSLELGAGSRARFSARAWRNSGLAGGEGKGPSLHECVFLHGSLESLRCFLCGLTSSWDDKERELETLAGRQPTCPHCAGATAAREERGKRALGVGKLRPDIVLYGEEHPRSDLIGTIVQHDLSLGPDMLLILGTSLRVHGLKTVVREFAKAVHSKGGKVVFVNFTKPPDSVWSDVIDFWVQSDCDAWVLDIKTRKP